MIFKIIFLGLNKSAQNSIVHTFYAPNWSMAKSIFKDWAKKMDVNTDDFDLEES